MIEQKHLTSSSLKNYNGYFKISKDREIKCYTKKQMHSLHPRDDYSLLGEYCNKNTMENCIGDISVEDLTLPLTNYKHNNRFIYAEKGYLRCDSDYDSYIVLLKNVFINRLIIVLLCLVIIFSGFYFFNSRKSTVKDILNIDENATDWQPNSNQNQESNSKNGTEIPGFASVTIPANTKNINLSLGNPAKNTCYFRISIVLDDGTELFKSDLVEPGKGFKNITLTRGLNPGSYNATIKYETFSQDGFTPMNGANLKITINVQ